MWYNDAVETTGNTRGEEGGAEKDVNHIIFLYTKTPERTGHQNHKERESKGEGGWKIHMDFFEWA